ncbi:MAG: electron transport complex subunit RsxC, partial [Myxococcales bacterium]|nr:electron transport complex subunit RsxC [Myxococcales bacterium]
VKAGDKVIRGQLIAEPVGFVSSAIHAPVTGTVVAVAPRRHPDGKLVPAIEIETDPYADQALPRREPLDWRAMSPDEFVRSVQQAGIVGLGGAAFPSHVKYSIPEGKKATRLVLNGSECEPYLTCDHRTMLEHPDKVLRGAEILGQHLGVTETVVGIEKNKPDAVDALRAAAATGKWGGNIDVHPVEVKYPQGAEKLLIQALFQLEVPTGQLPLDLEMVVNNVGTSAAIADWFDHGIPLVERVVTVSGPGVARPANLIVPLGTPVIDVFEQCGGLLPEAEGVVMGGPMMGQPLGDLNVPVMKGTSGLLAFTKSELDRPTEHACVRCGRCLDACPYFLNPSRLARLARAERWAEMTDWHVMDCMECGAC